MRLQTRLLDKEQPADIAQLQAVLDAAPQYHLLVEGKLASADSAHEELHALPPGKGYEDKFFYLFSDNAGQALGVADVIRGYPLATTVMIGLLLFCEPAQGQGYGAEALAQIRSMARQWKCTTLRIGVVETNQRGLAFWQREGFVEVARKLAPQFTGEVIVLEASVA